MIYENVMSMGIFPETSEALYCGYTTDATDSVVIHVFMKDKRRRSHLYERRLFSYPLDVNVNEYRQWDTKKTQYLYHEILQEYFKVRKADVIAVRDTPLTLAEALQWIAILALMLIAIIALK